MHFFYLRKKYVQRLQIRHSYGDDIEDDPVSEDIATEVTQAAMANGTAPSAPVLEPVPAPAGAEVHVGGKKCKWCGGTTHQRKSHKDCPLNKSMTEGQTISSIKLNSFHHRHCFPLSQCPT